MKENTLEPHIAYALGAYRINKENVYGELKQRLNSKKYLYSCGGGGEEGKQKRVKKERKILLFNQTGKKRITCFKVTEQERGK